jgi:predicted phosphodiesterase/biotin operon repressor
MAKRRRIEDIAAEIPAEASLGKQVVAALNKARRRKAKKSVLELSNELDRSPSSIQDALRELAEQGYNIEVDSAQGLELSSTIPKAPIVKISTREYFGDDWIRFGLIADTHLVSKYERLDVLHALYDIFEREGIRTVYHAGNWIDGEARFNKYDLHCIGLENQVKYFLANYPRRKDITTHILSGDDHEGWYVQREQINVGQVMQARARESGRNDLFDLGYMERDISFRAKRGQNTIRVIHAGGGSTYAISYTSQKYVESLQGGEKPSLVLVGHFHKFDFSYPREVNVIQGGCTQDQTPFMRKKRIQAMVGGCTVEIKQTSNGVFARTKVEWLPFYDKRFYSYKW